MGRIKNGIYLCILRRINMTIRERLKEGNRRFIETADAA
jgi:hypothetical protein